MMPQWFPISVLLGVLNLDVTAFGQFMVSRPIVVGPLVGWVMGQPGLGLEIGAIIELIWIGDVPVGAHLPPDLLMLTGISTACAAGLLNGRVPAEAAVTFGMCVGIPLALFSTEVENIMRKLHVRWMHFAQRMAMSGHFRTFEWVNWLIFLELFLKAFLVAAASLAAAQLASKVFFLFSDHVIEGLYSAYWLLLALGCSAVIDLLVEKKTAVYLAFSIACAGLAVFFRVPGVYLVSLMVFAGLVLALVLSRKGEPA